MDPWISKGKGGGWRQNQKQVKARSAEQTVEIVVACRLRK